MKKRKYDEMKALKGLIKRKNISYRMFAEKMEMSLDAINNKLNGYTAFNLHEAEKIIKILDIRENEVNKYFFPACCETQQSECNEKYVLL